MNDVLFILFGLVALGGFIVGKWVEFSDDWDVQYGCSGVTDQEITTPPPATALDPGTKY